MLNILGIAKENDTTLAIDWSDGRSDRIDVIQMRRGCPCAGCVDEHTGVRTLRESDVASDVRPVEFRSIGRYALGARFSDGHSTGIYTYELLRKLAL